MASTIFEKMRDFERSIEQSKIQLEHVKKKLEICYQYEEELEKKLRDAKAEREKTKEEFFIHCGAISARVRVFKVQIGMELDKLNPTSKK